MGFNTKMLAAYCEQKQVTKAEAARQGIYDKKHTITFFELTFDNKSPKILLSAKVRWILADKKKMGRPTENPKPHMVYARISDDELQILESYCKKNSITKPEAIRQAIRGLLKN